MAITAADVSKLRKITGAGMMDCKHALEEANGDFVKFAQTILNHALEKSPADLNELRQLNMEGRSVGDQVIEQVGIIGEKIDLSYYGKLEAAQVVPYIHPGNKLATLVGLNKTAALQVGRDVAMQVAAMNPVAVDRDSISDA